MVDYSNTFTQFGRLLRALRRLEAVKEQLNDGSPSTKAIPEIIAAYDETVADELDAEINVLSFLKKTSVPALRTAHRGLQAQIERSDDFAGVLDAELETSATDKAAGMIKYVYDTSDPNGEVTILNRQGRLGALRAAMIEDAEAIEENIVTVSGLAAMPGTVGALVSSTATGKDHAFSGTAILSFDNDTFPRKYKVELQYVRELPSGVKFRAGDTIVRGTVGQRFEDGPTGLDLTVDFDDPVESGDNNNFFSSSTVSSLTFQDAGDVDTNLGIWYVSVDHFDPAPDPEVIRIRWYADEDRTDLRATETLTFNSGVSSISIEADGGMIWNTTVNKTNIVAALPAVGDADIDIEFDMQMPRNGDRFKFTVKNGEQGNFATKIGKRWPADLYSSGTPTITDGLASSVSFS